MDNQNKIFDYALSAKKVKSYEGNKFKGVFEIIKSTSNLYQGISGLKFTIYDPNEEKVTRFKHTPKLYIRSGSLGNWTLQSLLFVLEKSKGSFYGRNIETDKEKKDLLILEFSKSGKAVNIFVASSLIGSKNWVFYLNPIREGKYDSQINGLLSQLKEIER